MANPLLELQHMLTAAATVPGKVVSIVGKLAFVATPSGLVPVPSDSGFEVGDPVNVANGKAVRVQDDSAAPVYFV